MLNLESSIMGAIHWWLCENCTKNKEVFAPIRDLLGLCFKYANSLYSILYCHPLPSIDQNINSEFGGINTYFSSINMRPSDFFILRGIISIVGNDMYFILKKAIEFSQNLDNDTLFSILERFFPLLEEYRPVRNFFAHLDERLDDREKHGLSGEYLIPEIKVTFLPTARNIFYMIYSGDQFFFHDKQAYEEKSTPKQVSFSKSKIESLFSLFRELYDLFTSHSLHSEVLNYPPSNTIFRLE